MPNKDMRVVINGFGRIGRLLLRHVLDSDTIPKIGAVTVSDLKDISICAYLLKYDSAHGVWGRDVQCTNNEIVVDGVVIPYCKNSRDKCFSWNKDSVDLVFDCTGRKFGKNNMYEYASKDSPVVLLSAPCDDADCTIVYGINHQKMQKTCRLISCASCTTNCLVPILFLLHSRFGIIKGMMNTVHAYTADQRLVDGNHQDCYRARAAAVSIIPTSTGAVNSVDKIIPELANKISGFAVRVPTVNVSQLLLTVQLEQKVLIDQLKQCFLDVDGVLQRVVLCSSEPLVSIDCNHSSASAIVSLPFLRIIDDLVHVMAWYDNEWGYVNRMLDVAQYFYSQVLNHK